ncbi:MAG: MBL fold metallo-hydrolase RNA specificity domain-containing protein [Phycisphaerales bacterium]
MKIHILGAAGGVTGSCYLVESDRARVLVDFGLFQGNRRADLLNHRKPTFGPDRLDAVVLSHAHLDHSGRLPQLVKGGYRGRIIATPATIELAGILLRDSAFLQQMDAERAAKRRRRLRPEQVPLYTPEEVEQTLPLFEPMRYDEPREIAPGVRARFVDAGHILGSASVELIIADGGSERTVVFSADIGPKGAPLLRDPVRLQHADLVFLESTYGDRDHRSLDASIDELVGIIRTARTPKGKVLIPSFAVGRTQQLIYFLGELMRSGALEPTEVVIDSPMATSATQLYRSHRDLFDDEAWAIINAGDTPLHFDTLRFTQDAEDSKALNHAGSGVVIISASGMCTGGRIVHHLRHGLPRSATEVVFVGFQARGTLGRRLVDGKRQVKIFGRGVAVEAGIHTLGGFSAHAGQTELVEWMTDLAPHKPRVLLTHGENGPRRELAKKLQERWGLKAAMPELGEIVEL